MSVDVGVVYHDDNSWLAYCTYLLTKLLYPTSASPAGLSLNTLLDSINVLGLNGYDLLTLGQSLLFHLSLVLLFPSLLSSPRLLLCLFLCQLLIAVWAYRAFLPYVSAKEGGKRDLYRFSLLTRPDSSNNLHALDSTALTLPTSPPPFYTHSSDDDEEGEEQQRGRGGRGGQRSTRAASAAPISSSAIRDVTDPSSPTPPSTTSTTRTTSTNSTTTSTSNSPSPSTRSRRLSTSETISALKRPLLHSAARQRKKLTAFQSITLQTLNPFVNRTYHISRHEHIRLSLAMAFLFPFRLTLFILLFILAYLHCKLCIMGVTVEAIKTRPLAEWRRQLLVPLRWYCRALLLVMGYVHIGQKGRPAAAKDAPIVVCNHLGFVEPVLLLCSLLPSPVGAEENLTLPVLGVICQALQAVPVRRRDRQSRGELVKTMKRRCEEGGWPQIMIFPEGTTTNGQSLITFKSGAFIAGKSVQPVCVQFPTGSRVNPAWVSCGPTPLQLLVRLLAEPFTRANIEYLPVHQPTAEERSDSNLFAVNVRAEIAKALQAAWTSPLYQNLPSHDRRHTTSLELSAVQSVVDLDVPSALLLLKRFTALDVRGVGRLTYDELRAGLGVRDGPEMMNLFAAMDEQETGEIDFREYLAGLAMIEKAHDTIKGGPSTATEEGRMRLICRLLDTEDEGTVRMEQIMDVLQRSTLDDEQQRRWAEQLKAATTQGEQGPGQGSESLTFDQLTSLLRADRVLFSELHSSLLSPLPTESLAPTKLDAAEAYVEAEAKGWRSRVKERVEKIKRRFS